MTIEIDQLSRIGFGAYRVGTVDPHHRAALMRALELGCNLVDTAVSYGDGRSEQLIGEVLAMLPDRPAFVITKVGYIAPTAERRLREAGFGNALQPLSDEARYSLDPDVVRSELAASAQRLRLSRLDCVLLHNPEHLAATGPDRAAALRRVFELFEDMIAAGALRGYGVSSNALASEPGGLAELVEIARGVSTNHGFRFVQFPYNLLETGAAPVIADARAAGLVTIANRALTSMRGGRVVRFVTAGEPADPEGDRRIYDATVALIADQLARLDVPHQPMDFMVMQFLRDNWSGVETAETVDAIFDRHFRPFVDHLWGDDLPASCRATFGELHRRARAHARWREAAAAAAVRDELERAGVVAADDRRDFAVIAAEHALAAGVDHVLLGMRRTAYVEAMRPLLERDAAPVRSWLATQRLEANLPHASEP